MNNKVLVNFGIVAIFTVSAVFCCQAQDTVYSVNIVGIQRSGIEPDQLDMVGTPFIQSPTQTLNEVIGEQLTTGFSAGAGDAIYVWNGTAYDTYFRLTPISDPQGRDNKWIDTGGNLATNYIPPGIGFWIKNNQDVTQSVVLVGDVELGDTVDLEVDGGLQIMSYPYSSALNLYSNDTLFASGAVPGFSSGDADTIYVWDKETLQFKDYILLAFVGNPAIDNKWINPDNGNPADFDIEPGQAFWYKHQGTGFTWTENKPYQP